MIEEQRRPRITLPRPLWLGLATVLVMVTVSALRIGIPIYRQRAAIEFIEALGGRIETDLHVPAWIVDRFGFRSYEAAAKFDWLFREADRASLFDTPATDSTLECFRVLPDIAVLELSGTQVTDAGLEHLKGLTKLWFLRLDGTQVSGAGLVHLKGLNELVFLDLEGTQVTDAGLKHLGGLPKLKVLYLGGTQVTDAGMKHLAGLTNLGILLLDRSQVTSRGVAELKTAIPGLFAFEGVSDHDGDLAEHD
jgi:internalin A